MAIRPNISKHGVRTIAVLLSFILHSFIVLIQFEAPVSEPMNRSDPVSVKIIKRKSIVEAKLTETAPPSTEAYLGQQDHRTDKEIRLDPRNNQSIKGADASSRSNQKKPSNEFIQDYESLLPGAGDLSASYNDFIPDSELPIGEELDVNTTEYKYLGYATAIRKAVGLAFYSPLSSLKNEPHIKEKMKHGSQVRLSGYSKARLTIERSGLLSNVDIVESSGDKSIDQAWTRILNLAAPFPPLPRHFLQETLVINYTLFYDYVLRDEQRVRRFRF